MLHDFETQIWLSGAATGDAEAASLILVPLLSSRGNNHGWILFATCTRDRRFEMEDTGFVQDIAQRLTHAAEIVLMYENALRDVRIREDFVSIVSHDLVNASLSMKLSAQSVLRSARSPDNA